MTDPFARFHAAHHDPTPLVLPNAWDAASAALLLAEGFTAIGTTSLGVAAGNGLPDGTGSTREETRQLAERLARAVALLTVDIEAGFSDDPAEVAGFVAELAADGVVGINIEDGRSDGGLRAASHHAEVVAAIKRRTPRLFVNARTDAFWLGADDPLRTALHRAESYRAAGADGIFVPGATGEADIAALVAGIALPVNVLFNPGGPDVAALAKLGVARISTGSLLFRAALGAATATARAVRDGGTITSALPSYQAIQQHFG